MEVKGSSDSINGQPLLEKTDYKNIAVSFSLIISAIITIAAIQIASDPWNFLAVYIVYPILLLIPFLVRYSLGRVVSLRVPSGFNWSFLLVFALLAIGFFQPFFTMVGEVGMMLLISISICIKEIRFSSALTVKVFAEVFLVLSVFCLGVSFILIRPNLHDIVLRYATEKVRTERNFSACRIPEIISLIVGYKEQECKYAGANYLGYKNVDPESITDSLKRNEVYLQSANESGDVTLCEKIDDPQKKDYCFYNYYVNNHPNEITLEICSSLQIGKTECLSKIAQRCSDDTCYEKIGQCYKLPEAQRQSCFISKKDLAIQMCMVDYPNKSGCLNSAAISLRDTSICDKSEGRDSCLSSMAAGLKDISICNKIQNQWYMDECKEFVNLIK